VLDELLLYDLTDSPFCLKARICLHWKAVPFRRVTLTVGRLRQLRRLNPLGQVPVLVHGGEAVADSSAIARHLEQHWPDPPLLPADPVARAYCALVEEWADEALSFIVGAFKWLNPENRPAAVANTATEMAAGPLQPLLGWAIARTIRGRYRRWGYGPAALGRLGERMRENLGALDALLAGRRYLVGRTLTLADIAVFAQLRWMARYREARLLADAPEVSRWLAEVGELPAVAAALPA
jgi:glutathione S-transferase